MSPYITYYLKHMEEVKKRHSEYHKKYRVEIRFKVLLYYSNGSMKCAKCGYSDMRALSIDHINGGGNQHRIKTGYGDSYHWLLKNNYPEGYQVLCMNRQFIKRIENREVRGYKEGYTPRSQSKQTLDKQ